MRITDLHFSLQLIASQIPYKKAGDLIVEFDESQGSERQVILDLPKGMIGKGWQLVPLAKPTEVSDQNCRHTYSVATIALSTVAHL